MQGIADGSGLDYNQIRRINLFPELIRATCTMAGTWGSATASGHLLQLRALDWYHGHLYIIGIEMPR
jgi:hypothetical protein